MLVLISPQAFATEVFFSPNENIAERIVREINLTTGSIDIAMYSFTSSDIAQALETAKLRGVMIRLIVDKSQLKSKSSEVAWLDRKGFVIKVMDGSVGRRGIMHNKFVIFNKKVLMTGSYNWTTNAERYNFENMLVINEINIVNRYVVEFNKLWSLR